MAKATIKYKPKTKTADNWNVVKAVLIPLLLFILGLFVINSLGTFGSKLVSPMAGVCYIFGTFVAFYMPSERKQTLKETSIFMAGYFAGLYLFKCGIGLTSGVSAEMISASFDQAIPTSVGNALPGYLQTAMLITSVMGPIGFLGLQAKRLVTLRRNKNLQKAFVATQGIRNTGREHIDNYIG